MTYDLKLLAQQVQHRIPTGNDQEPDIQLLRNQVVGFLLQARTADKLDDLIRQMVAYVGINQLLPDCYVSFQPMVTESMVFLLQQLPLERLAVKSVDQLLLDPNSTPGRRICVLIKDMPSLQKLGQIICRAPGLAPEFKEALVELEDNIKTVNLAELKPIIDTELAALKASSKVILDDCLLAEASVCAVVGAEIFPKGEQNSIKAVLKILKPHVRDNLIRELKMLNALALFLDQNNDRWGLKDFKFKDTLEQVQWLLENEVDLSREQSNLKDAGRYYRSQRELAIPRCLGSSTPAITVMTRVEGRKITDVSDLAQRRKRLLAKTLTETCILRPIKDLGDLTLFHGDPHGGNIAYVFKKAKPRIILYDWGMLGRLSRLERFAFALMGLGVMSKSATLVLFSMDIVSGGQIFKREVWHSDLSDTVDRILEQRRTICGDVLTDIGSLLAESAYQGIRFPTDLLMFQKSQVTLKGVIADIDPRFNFDEHWMRIAVGSYLGDLCRPRYYWEIYKEIWAMRRYSVRQVLKLHHLMFKLLRRVGGAGLKNSLGLAVAARLLVPATFREKDDVVSRF